MTATETWTVGKLLTWTTEYLKKNGSSSPRLDAEVLLAHARECQRIELYTAFDEEPADDVKAGFREMVKRRAEGTPVAYLVGYKEFYSNRFEVNPDVLIPRPETEHLIVEALDCAKELSANRSEPLKIADIGTGSGIVAVTAAKHVSDSLVIAVDISAAALSVARRNADNLGVAERIEFVEGDLLSGFDAEESFDLILSNPPYVSAAEYDQLDRTVKEYEPKIALVSEPSGGELIERLARQALSRLVPGGYLLFELSPMLAAKTEELLGEGWAEFRIAKDLAGHARVVVARKAA